MNSQTRERIHAGEEALTIHRLNRLFPDGFVTNTAQVATDSEGVEFPGGIPRMKRNHNADEMQNCFRASTIDGSVRKRSVAAISRRIAITPRSLWLDPSTTPLIQRNVHSIICSLRTFWLSATPSCFINVLSCCINCLSEDCSASCRRDTI